MKHKIKTGSIFMVMLICLFSSVILLHASDPLTASIVVSGNAGRKITLTSDKKNVFPDHNPDKQSAVIGSNGTAGFTLTYDEPDDYVYTLTTDNKEDKPITVKVSVYVDDKSKALKSVLTAYDPDGKKVDKIDFTQTPSPIKPVTNTSTKKHQESANTGMNSDPEFIIGIGTLIAGIIIAFMTCITMKHLRRENR